MNEYFTRFVENLIERTRSGELHWENVDPNGFEEWLHADKSLCMFFCLNFGKRFYISFGTKGDEFVYEIAFSHSRETNSFLSSLLTSLAANELNSDFELALRELVDVVRFGWLKQLVEQCVLAEKEVESNAGKEEK